MANFTNNSCFVLIVGGGILGLSVARELINRGVRDIALIEKEPGPGLHASGRNSGILHSGLYYAQDSLKARFCLEGNRRLREFCQQFDLPLLETGKVIVTKDEKELPELYNLLEKAKLNKVPVKLIDEKELSEIEPHAKTYQKALYSPLTAVVSPSHILQTLHQQIHETGQVKFLFQTLYLQKLTDNSIQTNRGPLHFQFLINVAGAYADLIAHQFDVGKEHIFMPFRGQYKKLSPSRNMLVKGNIYPVPRTEMPFLGIHFSRSVDGQVYIGPNAMPAIGREHYQGCPPCKKETFLILQRLVQLYFSNRKFRKLGHQEIANLLPIFYYQTAQNLLPQLSPADILPSTKSGIRPQLVNWKTKELVMDFVVEKNKHSIHVLNAISPAFTCAFPMAKYLVDLFQKSHQHLAD